MSLQGDHVAIPPEIEATISLVRDDKHPTDWCLCGFANGCPPLTLLASGEGGAVALSRALASPGLASTVAYGLLRTADQIDATTMTKFVFLSFIGSDVPVMRRAKISTHKGMVTAAFEPFHAELMNVTSADEARESTAWQPNA